MTLEVVCLHMHVCEYCVLLVHVHMCLYDARIVCTTSNELLRMYGVVYACNEVQACL
jgi:hypothetical protein